MKRVLLTPGEISRAAYERNELFEEWASFAYTRKANADEEIAKAQLKNVVDWLHEDIRREITKDGEIVVFRKSSEDWQSLLAELEK